MPMVAAAQDTTYTSPRTVDQKIFSGQTTAATSPVASAFPCTPVNGAPCGIPNLGQTLHSFTYSISNPCTTGFFMDLRLEGTQDGSTWFAISQDATDEISGAIQGNTTTAGLTAIGQYAGYRLNLVTIGCAGGGSTPALTASYSGTSTSNPTPTSAFYQDSPYRKVILQNQPTTNANSQAAVTIAAPNGNSGGALYFSCWTAATGLATACPSGMGVTLIAYVVFGGGSGGTNAISQQNTYTVNPITSPVTEVYSNPATSMSFTFSGSGTAGVNWSIYYVSNSTPTQTYVNDPCAGTGSRKNHTFATFTTAQASTQLLPGISGTQLYICGFTLNMVGTTTADTVQFQSANAGGSCTSPSPYSPVYSTGTSGGIFNLAYGGSGSVFAPLGVGQALCVTVAVGTSPNVAILVTYVQQ
jgi:hypothetical protein